MTNYNTLMARVKKKMEKKRLDKIWKIHMFMVQEALVYQTNAIKFSFVYIVNIFLQTKISAIASNSHSARNQSNSTFQRNNEITNF